MASSPTSQNTRELGNAAQQRGIFTSRWWRMNSSCVTPDSIAPRHPPLPTLPRIVIGYLPAQSVQAVVLRRVDPRTDFVGVHVIGLVLSQHRPGIFNRSMQPSVEVFLMQDRRHPVWVVAGVVYLPHRSLPGHGDMSNALHNCCMLQYLQLESQPRRTWATGRAQPTPLGSRRAFYLINVIAEPDRSHSDA